MADVVFPASAVVGPFCKRHSALGMNGEPVAGDAPSQPHSDRNRDAPPAGLRAGRAD